ncbi:MAG: mechanosensitive ion channel [Magnetococcales bacterium]|nr:mechanosensitive ion channel [Magnetococcales bacterium]
MRKTNKLLIILGTICILSLIGTYFARHHLTASSKQPPLYITVAGNTTAHASDPLMDSMRNAAELAIEHFGQLSRMPGRQVILEQKTGFDTPESARKAAQEIAEQNKAAVVIGHWPAPILKAMGPVFAQANIPVVSLSSEHLTDAEERQWLFRMVPTVENQAQFLGNYARNVMGEKIVTILHDDSSFGQAMVENFEKIYLLFGTKIHKKLSVPGDTPDKEALFDQFAKEIKESQDGSALVLGLNMKDAALFLKKLRDRKARNLVIGPDLLATHAFRATLQQTGGSQLTTADYTNQLIVSAPLLFDTANQAAQRFKNQFSARNGGKSADWVSAYAYETTQALLNTVAESWNPEAQVNTTTDRQKISIALSSIFGLSNDKLSLTDGNLFGGQGKNTKPILVGRYSGENLVSALTQLHPIKESIQRSGTTNYLEELQHGRMLFVNDRFMYKTNVVYTGFEVTEISDLDLEKNSFSMEFFVWFRYRGSFNPEAIEFANAIEPLELKEPAESVIKDDLSFKLFKLKGKFVIDHLDTKRPFGSHVIGTSFRHKTLNRNNALFVVDILGMGLEANKTVLDMVATPQVINPNMGWKIDQAWVSQERFLTSSLGKPAYVGFGTAEPEFSRIDLGMIVSKEEFAARDFIPYEYFIYLGIFGLIGLIFALGIDANTQGAFWKITSWSLRVIFWPIFLISFGNLFLDYAYQQLSPHMTEYFLLSYKVLWWLIPAMLTTMALERFLWEPLERHAHQAIPKVVRNIGAFLVYLLAGFGVTAFVFDEKLTSLLATSGLITMIIGLAVQSNIANIFSGIAVNVERPFSVGDWLKIGPNEDAQLVDITWRTMRLRTRSGLILSIPNAKATEMLIINYSHSREAERILVIHVSPTHDPQRIKELLIRAMVESQLRADRMPDVEFHGIVNHLSRWVAKYEAIFWVKDYASVDKTEAEIWELIWKLFRRHGVSLAPETAPPVSPGLLHALLQEQTKAPQDDADESDDRRENRDSDDLQQQKEEDSTDADSKNNPG